MPLNVGWLGVFIALTTKNGRWEAAVAWRTGQSGAPPDSPVCHRTLSGAPPTSRSPWTLTIGAEVFWTTGQSGGAPDRSCRLSGAPSRACLTSVCSGAH
jgi:hypothetical protein